MSLLLFQIFLKGTKCGLVFKKFQNASNELMPLNGNIYYEEDCEASDKVHN